MSSLSRMIPAWSFVGLAEFAFQIPRSASSLFVKGLKCNYDLLMFDINYDVVETVCESKPLRIPQIYGFSTD